MRSPRPETRLETPKWARHANISPRLENPRFRSPKANVVLGNLNDPPFNGGLTSAWRVKIRPRLGAILRTGPSSSEPCDLGS